jgi:pyruvate dehydrogenase E2 component (dihydrolipoamide acetyltransferase)
MTNVVLPELGEGIDKATVSYWIVQKGQKVNEKDDLVEMATDKATFNVPSPCSGVVTQINCEEGKDVKVGEILAVIDETQA